MMLSQRDQRILEQRFSQSILKQLDHENQRVSRYTQHLLDVLAWNSGAPLKTEEQQSVLLAAYLHDLGKLLIPESILNKPGKLTPDEFNIVKGHTIKGAHIVAQLPDLRGSVGYPYVYDVCFHHHERWNGAGYPEGLKGPSISCWAQVVALADVYDALRTARPYKPAYTHDEAVEMICEGACGTFSGFMINCLIDAQANFKS